MAFQHDVQAVAGLLLVWTVDLEEGAAFVSSKPQGHPWRFSPHLMVEEAVAPVSLLHRGRWWVPLTRVSAGYMPRWNALFASHLEVRDRVLRGR